MANHLRWTALVVGWLALTAVVLGCDGDSGGRSATDAGPVDGGHDGGGHDPTDLPVLHLRAAAMPPPLVTTLQHPAEASAWYPASPTYYGLGGQTGDRNHTEVLATYDDAGLYLALLTIDRATVLAPAGVLTDITRVDSHAVWIQTPDDRTFCLVAALDDGYPPGPVQASGELADFDPTADRLPGWSHTGWQAGGMTFQQTIHIPWSAFDTSAPALGSQWRVNFVTYNQTADARNAATVRAEAWAPGSEAEPDQWGTLAFDEAVYTPPQGVSPEAVLTLRPGASHGGEVTLRAGNAADETNGWDQEAITQSDWNDWDPVDYTIKELLQFDLTFIPPGRRIIAATLRNHFRGHFNEDPSDQYLHVLRLARPYDPATVTMLSSPPPVENGFRRLVQISEVDSWIELDVSDAVATALDRGLSQTSFVLTPSTGDLHNGKIWNVSYGRADWYDSTRPQLVITFGEPGVSYDAPVHVGSLNYTSVASTTAKNKLTNGTFRYGAVEGSTNTTYWHAEPGFVSVGGSNQPLMRMVGDTNPTTGNPALRYAALVGWRGIRQLATGLAGGQPYTFSGWFKGSSAGVSADVRIECQDGDGNPLAGGDGYAAYGGSGNWEQVLLTVNAPVGTVQARVEIICQTESASEHLLYSDFQLEQGSTATEYSETMGVYYPDHPRTDGVSQPGG